MIFKQKKALVISDFDGTICTTDMGNSVLSQFTKESWNEIDREYVKGTIGSRIAYSRIAPLIEADAESVRKFVLKKGRIDPFFKKFYNLAKSRNIDVKIVSDGLNFYIRTMLEKYGLSDIEFYSNDLAFGSRKDVSIEFPQMNELCGRCGTCKNKILNDHRLLYEQIIYVGDGHSDICPSRYADLIFAKDVLLKKCEEEGHPSYLPFRNFDDIRKYLENM